MQQHAWTHSEPASSLTGGPITDGLQSDGTGLLPVDDALLQLVLQTLAESSLEQVSQHQQRKQQQQQVQQQAALESQVALQLLTEQVQKQATPEQPAQQDEQQAAAEHNPMLQTLAETALASLSHEQQHQEEQQQLLQQQQEVFEQQQLLLQQQAAVRDALVQQHQWEQAQRQEQVFAEQQRLIEQQQAMLQALQQHRQDSVAQHSARLQSPDQQRRRDVGADEPCLAAQQPGAHRVADHKDEARLTQQVAGDPPSPRSLSAQPPAGATALPAAETAKPSPAAAAASSRPTDPNKKMVTGPELAQADLSTQDVPRVSSSHNRAPPSVQGTAAADTQDAMMLPMTVLPITAPSGACLLPSSPITAPQAYYLIPVSAYGGALPMLTPPPLASDPTPAQMSTATPSLLLPTEPPAAPTSHTQLQPGSLEAPSTQEVQEEEQLQSQLVCEQYQDVHAECMPHSLAVLDERSDRAFPETAGAASTMGSALGRVETLGEIQASLVSAHYMSVMRMSKQPRCMPWNPLPSRSQGRGNGCVACNAPTVT